MKKITGDQFVEMWKNPVKGEVKRFGMEDVLHFKDCQIEGEVRITVQQNQIGLLFENCNLTSIIVIRSFPNSEYEIGSISFISTSVNYFWLEGLNIRRITIANNSNVVDLKVENSTIKESIELLQNSAIRSVNFIAARVEHLSFLENSKIGPIKVQDKSSIARIILSDSILFGIRFSGGACCEHIELKNSSVRHFFYFIDGTVVEQVMILNVMIFSGIVVKNAKVQSLILEDCSAGNIDFLYKSEIDELEIRDSKIAAIRIRNSRLLETKIHRSKLISIDTRYLNEARSILIVESRINEFSLEIDRYVGISLARSEVFRLSIMETSVSRDSVIRISDSKFNTVMITSVICSGVLSFNNLQPLKSCSILKVNERVATSNEETFTFFYEDKLEHPTLFILANSDLGKTTFINCNLNAFDQFVFLNTKMLETFVADTILPHIDKISSLEEKNTGVALLEQKRLALGQFKKVYENRGDVVKALEYHAQEMEVYREYLKGVSLKWPKAFFDIWGERINLWANRWSSYYGTNWVRATLSTLFVGWGVFAIYCWVLGFRPGADTGRFWELFSYSFEFINPLRKADFLEHAFLDSHKEPLYPVTPGARVVDYVARIIMAYMVYQTIQAFRKFGKKAV